MATLSVHNNRAIRLAYFICLICLFGFLLQACYKGTYEDASVYGPIAWKPGFSTLPLDELWCVRSEKPISRPLYGQGSVFTLDFESPITTHTVYSAHSGGIAWKGTSANRNIGAGIPGYGLVHDDWYVSGDGDSVTVFESRTGEVLWDKTLLTNGGFSAGDGKLFVGTQPTIIAYDLETGSVVWKARGQGRGEEAPLLDPLNSVVIVSNETYRLLDTDSGEVLLETQIDPRSSARSINIPYEHNHRQIYNGLLLNYDEAIDVKTGKVMHQRSLPAANSFPPTIIANVMMLSAYEDVLALDLTSFEVLWRYHAPQYGEQQLEVIGDPVVLNDVVYIILSDATIRALDLETGAEIGLWQGEKVVDRRFRLTPIVPGMAVGDGMLFAAFGTNELCAFGER